MLSEQELHFFTRLLAQSLTWVEVGVMCYLGKRERLCKPEFSLAISDSIN